MNSKAAFLGSGLGTLALALTLTSVVALADRLPAGAAGELGLKLRAAEGGGTMAGFAWDGFGTNLLAPGSAGLLVDGRFLTNGFGPIEETSGRGWRCRVAVADRPANLAAGGSGPTNLLSHWERRVLEIESGLVVIFDDVVLRQPAVTGVALRTVAAPVVDPRWQDLRLQLAGAGWTAIALGEPAIGWSVAESGEAGVWESRATGVAAATTARRITVLAAQGAGPRVSVVAKLLQSESAFGVRVHRDGLPALVAFRVAPGTASATLAGFEFTGPVGVDEFRPKAQRPR